MPRIIGMFLRPGWGVKNGVSRPEGDAEAKRGGRGFLRPSTRAAGGSCTPQPGRDTNIDPGHVAPGAA